MRETHLAPAEAKTIAAMLAQLPLAKAIEGLFKK